MLIEEARQLYAVPPANFVATRNGLAKALKADGRADDAKLVGGLRRPRLAEYGLNALAHHDQTLIARFAAAVTAAQDAQSAAIGGDAGGLREATNELRQSTNAVVDAAVAALDAEGGNGSAQRDDLVSLLRTIVSNADPRPLVAGVIGSEALVGTGEFFPGAPDPPAESSARGKPASKPKPAASDGQGADVGDVGDVGDDGDVGGGAVSAPAERAAKAETSTAAARRAVARAERSRLVTEQKSADAALAAAKAAVEAAADELAARRKQVKVAEQAAKAAAAELAAFDDTTD